MRGEKGWMLSDRKREEDRCREGERRWEYICCGQCCETRQVAVTLKMTVIKVTVGRWIWWFWLANQSSVKRTTAPDSAAAWHFLIDACAPIKKGPLTVVLLNWVKWLGKKERKNLLSHSVFADLPFISFRFSSFFSYHCRSGSWGWCWDWEVDVNQRGLACVCVSGRHALYVSTGACQSMRGLNALLQPRFIFFFVKNANEP